MLAWEYRNGVRDYCSDIDGFEPSTFLRVLASHRVNGVLFSKTSIGIRAAVQYMRKSGIMKA
jgi:hypothetical protein